MNDRVHRESQLKAVDASVNVVSAANCVKLLMGLIVNGVMRYLVYGDELAKNMPVRMGKHDFSRETLAIASMCRRGFRFDIER